MCSYAFFFFFFKQKTAYEMRISDWSSDVCSSDLGTESRFMAVDGPHRARISDGEVSLEMKDVSRVEENEGDYILDTGSPHFIRITNQLTNLDVIGEDRKSTRLNSSH